MSVKWIMAMLGLESHTSVLTTEWYGDIYLFELVDPSYVLIFLDFLHGQTKLLYIVYFLSVEM